MSEKKPYRGKSDVFTVQAKGLDDVRKYLDRKNYKKAVDRSLLRSGRSVIAELPRAIKDHYGIKAGNREIKAPFVIRKRAGQGEIGLTYKGSRGVSVLKDFGAKQIYRMFKPRRGVRTTVGTHSRLLFSAFKYRDRKGGEEKIISGKKGNQPFVATMSNGFTTVFRRRKGEKKKIYVPLYGPGLGAMIRYEPVKQRLIKKFHERMKVEIEYNWKYFSGRR